MALRESDLPYVFVDVREVYYNVGIITYSVKFAVVFDEARYLRFFNVRYDGALAQVRCFEEGSRPAMDELGKAIAPLRKRYASILGAVAHGMN